MAATVAALLLLELPCLCPNRFLLPSRRLEIGGKAILTRRQAKDFSNKMNGVGLAHVIFETPYHMATLASPGAARLEVFVVLSRPHAGFKNTSAFRTFSFSKITAKRRPSSTPPGHPPHSQLIALPLFPRLVR